MTDPFTSDGTSSGGERIFASEVFSAIQGEGSLVGTRQIFVRLAGCNIRCAYCDQPESLERHAGPCRVEQSPGRRDWRVLDSPLPVADLLETADGLGRRLPHHSVSLTGGEPLLQGRACAAMAAGLSARGWPVMLETNGTLPGPLAPVVGHLAYVSMDVKLPSVDGEHVAPERQREFLDVSLSASSVETWVKIVLGAATDRRELDGAVRMVAEAAEGAARHAARAGSSAPEIFLQPVTPFAAVSEAPSPELVLELQARALVHYPRVRVIPQTHKAIGQL